MEGATEGQIRKVGRCIFKEGTRCLSAEKERKEKLGENPSRDELGSDDGAVPRWKGNVPSILGKRDKRVMSSFAWFVQKAHKPMRLGYKRVPSPLTPFSSSSSSPLPIPLTTISP